ncbi:protein of unknown function [Thauera humireducens]|nr:protein of unknown function [Thauera humireducens]
MIMGATLFEQAVRTRGNTDVPSRLRYCALQYNLRISSGLRRRDRRKTRSSTHSGCRHERQALSHSAP